MKIRLYSVLISLLAGSLWADIYALEAENDFEDGGIWYTITSPTTVQTRAGFIDNSSLPYKINFGNQVNGSVDIPETVMHDNQSYLVTAIGDYGFYGATEVSLPASLQSIGTSAFALNPITSIVIPASVTSLGASAFAECTSLTNVTLPEGISTIPAHIFSECTALSSIEIPESVTSIGAAAFYGCKGINELTLSENITAIGADAFNGCNLKTITSLATTPPTISSNAFRGSSAAKLNVPNSALAAYKSSYWGQAFTTIVPIPLAATAVTLNKTDITLYVSGPTTRLTATITPPDATDVVEWSVVPEEIASVTPQGVVKGLLPGTATVIATCGDVSASCSVTVIQLPPSSIVITPLTSTLYPGSTATMTAKINPVAGSLKPEWSSSNTDIVTIDANTGELTAIAPGAAVIYATAMGVTGKLSITINPILAETVTLSNNSLTIKTGDTEMLSAMVTPENTTDKTLVWTSSDTSVATVFDGIITAIAPGQADIKVACGDVSDRCVVTVEAIEATEITLSNANLALVAGQNSQLYATVEPENTTDKTILWTTSNPAVATVDQTGMVTAIVEGIATITATSGSVSADCIITVSAPVKDEIILDYNALVMRVGDSAALTANKSEISWASSDVNVATVSETGVVKAIGVGSTIITASSGELTANCEVTVEATLAESITIDGAPETLNVEQAMKLTANVMPETTTDKTVIWTSSDESVASISVEGLIKALNPGTVLVTASCDNVSASFIMNVLSPAKSITLNSDELTLTVGEVDDLIASVTPANTTDVVEWDSDNISVATVNAFGIVEAHQAGQALITARCGNVKASCTVTVESARILPTALTLDITTLSMEIGNSQMLVATVEPENTTEAIEWTSSDDAIAAVSSEGIVAALKIGTAIITASCGELNATCTVTVTDKTNGIESIKPDENNEYHVYSTSGIEVLTTKYLGRVKLLPSGVYIINGKKIYIRSL